MLAVLPGVLQPQEVARLAALLAAVPWEDGRASASGAAAEVKRNLQVPNRPELRKPLDEVVLPAIQRSTQFFERAFPKKLSPITYNRYDPGMTYGRHVDAAVLFAGRFRADVSFTLFLTPPAAYDGGELVLDGAAGALQVKRPAGDLVLYPTTSLHHVAPVTRGSRLAAVGWAESYVPDERQRAILADLTEVKAWLDRDGVAAPEADLLRNSLFNLLRLWWQT